MATINALIDTLGAVMAERELRNLLGQNNVSVTKLGNVFTIFFEGELSETDLNKLDHESAGLAPVSATTAPINIDAVASTTAQNIQAAL